VAERNWLKSGISGKLRPIPRVLSSSCGLCLETELPDGTDPLLTLAEWKIEWEQVVEVQGKGLKAIARKN
jgi:hypothetical protein